jgi:hypothetical protein
LAEREPHEVTPAPDSPIRSRAAKARRCLSNLGCANAFDHVVTHRPDRIVFRAGEQIATQSRKQAVGRQPANARRQLVARLILDFDNATRLDPLGDGCEDLAVDALTRARPRSSAPEGRCQRLRPSPSVLTLVSVNCASSARSNALGGALGHGEALDHIIKCYARMARRHHGGECQQLLRLPE